MFYHTMSQVRILAKHLQCTIYYSKVGTEEENNSHMRTFASSLVKMCTGTHMLVLRLNTPGVSVVI